MRLSPVGVALLLLCAQVVSPAPSGLARQPEPGDPPPSELRVGVGRAVNFNLAFFDSATEEIRGVGADLFRALAAQMGVSLEPVVYASRPAVRAALNEDAWDIATQSAAEARAAGALYAGSYLLVEQTYLVAEGSPFNYVADLDQAGVRIVVNRNTPGDSQLTRLLQHAEIIRSDVPGTLAGDPLFTADVDAYAFNREGLLTLAEQRPGFRVLEDSFAVTELGIALPPGKEALLEQVQAFLEDAKASGLVLQAIEANGVRGVRVAEPGQ